MASKICWKCDKCPSLMPTDWPSCSGCGSVRPVMAELQVVSFRRNAEIVTNMLGILLSLAGFALIVGARSPWATAAGVWLMIWGNNWEQRK